MRFRKPVSENERLVLSVLLVFIVYFGLNFLSYVFLVEKEEEPVLRFYRMSITFFVGMIAGLLFFIWTRSTTVGGGGGDVTDKNIEILRRALNEDEVRLLEIIRESEGVTQDSLRFRTGFSRSKVSTLLGNLEKNGIITREKLGRTYKLYISDWLKKG